MTEYIKRQDSLNTGREKINQALTNANTNADKAKIDSAEALLKAIASMNLSESLREQFNQIIIDGDSSVEAAAARVDEENITHDTLKERIDDGFTKTKTQLAETEQEIKDGTRNFKTVDSPSFCFIDDDSTINVYTELYPMFESKNAKFTIAAITGQIGGTNRMTEAHLLEMYNDGYDIMPHTHHHKNLTTLTEQEIIDDYEACKAYLDGLGIDYVNALAYPNGAYNDTVLKITSRYFDCALQTSTRNNPYPIETYAIRRVGIGSWGYTEWQPIKEKIDEAIENNLMFVGMLHIRDTPQELRYLITQSIDYIRSQGFEISSFRDAYEKHKNKFEHEDFGGKYIKVGADSSVEISGLGVEVLPANTITNDTPSRDINSGRIFHNIVTTSEAEGMPEEKGGYLTTYSISENYPDRYQEYKVIDSNNKYIRRATGAANWSRWLVQGNITDASADKPLFDAPQSQYQVGGVTRVNVSNSKASDAPTPNLGGVLETFNFFTDYNFCYQLYHPIGKKEIWKRTATSPSNWNTWEKVSEV